MGLGKPHSALVSAAPGRAGAGVRAPAPVACHTAPSGATSHPEATAMRLARAMMAALGATVAPVAAPTAAAAPIAVAFEGTFDFTSIPFAGTLFYESDTPNTGGNPPAVAYRFAPGTAGIRIETGDVVYASPEFVASSIPVLFDVYGNPVPPGDPDGVLQGSLFWWTGFGSNVPSSVDFLRIQQVLYVAEPPLPDSAGALADSLPGAFIYVSFTDTGRSLSGTITSAVPIPEPSSASLLGI